MQSVTCGFLFLRFQAEFPIKVIQSPSEARGLGNENGRSRRNRVVGGLGGILPPILGRKDFGGPGEAGGKGGSGRGSAAPSVVCLSVTGRTSPSCLGRS